MLRTLTSEREDFVRGMAGSDQAPAAAGPGSAGADSAAKRLAERKSLLRKGLITARASLSPAGRAAAGRSLRDAVMALPEAGMAGTIAAYLSVGTEPQTCGLVFALWKRGGYVLLPVLRGDNDLDWASYEGPDSLAPGPRGLLEPVETRRGTGAIASADLVIVPALAADRRGHRLGRGGGSYDRALARVGAAVLTVALLYDGELVDEVPAGAHDQRVRAVAQPEGGIIRIG
jgi:5-formyltetrahydrofolate cyclo-ligase